MIHKMAGTVVFLVLCCISAGAQDHRDKPGFSKDPIGPLIWGPVYRPGVDKTYLALGAAADQPLDITSKKVNFKNIRNGKEVVFVGNAKVKQGDVILTCDRLIIIYDQKTGAKTGEGKVKKLPKGLENSGQIKFITATGNVKIVQYERMAVGNEAVFDIEKRSIILKGGPALLRDGPELLNGAQIIINRDEISTGAIIEPSQNRK